MSLDNDPFRGRFRPIHAEGDPLVLCLMGCGGAMLDTRVMKGQHAQHHQRLQAVLEALGLDHYHNDERRPSEAVQTGGAL